jgi:hypothetical protein
MRGRRGFSYVEVLVVVVLLMLVLSLAVPALSDARRAAALSGAAAQLQGLFFRCRALAIMNARSYAVVFERRSDDSWRSFIAVDGDGDGVLRADIDRGVDAVVGDVVFFETDAAGLGILDAEYLPDPGGRGRLRGDRSDPVRAGRGDIVTFTPRGTATPCSVYLTDRHSRMRVLRVCGGTGRVIALRWRSGWVRWRSSGLW